jgi:hypothetical protein
MNPTLPVLKKWSGCFISLLFLTNIGKAQFVAFNDHAPATGTAANATTWNIMGNSPGSSGALKDIDSCTALHRYYGRRTPRRRATRIVSIKSF